MNLLYLLLLSSIFPSVSLYNIGSNVGVGFPLLLYPSLQIIIIISLIYKFLKDKSLVIILDQKKYLYCFFIYVYIVSMVSPIVFQGTEVIIPRLGLSLQSVGPLTFSMSITGQLIYLLLNISTLFYISDHKLSTQQKSRYLYSAYSRLDKFIYVIAVIPIIFLLWEILSRLFNLYYPYEILFSNEFGLHAYSQSFAGIYRFSSTFSEPSFFGLFSSGFAIFFLCKVRKLLSLDFLMYIVYNFTTLATTSTTGITALFFGHTVVIALSIFRYKEIISGKAKKLMIAAIPYILLVSAAIVFYELTQLIIKYQFIEKLTNESGTSRLGADFLSLLVLVRTYFIGAGLGANRPSSLLLYLASNTGLIGTLLFTFYLFLLIRRVIQQSSVNSSEYSCALSLLTVFFGMCIGVPDFNQPYLWFWIFLCELSINRNKILRSLNI